jgi:UDP-N-acetylmuramate dehydrogenase
LEEGVFKELKNEDCLFSYRDSIFKREKDRFLIYEITLKLFRDFNPNLSYALLDKFKSDLENGKLTANILREEIIKIRASKLPDYKQFPNCGSFFKNIILKKDEENKDRTEEIISKLQKDFQDIKIIESEIGYKIPTASLIEHIANMKGVKKGNFGISDKHALILINYDGLGNAEELDDFVKFIQDKIFEKVGIFIEKEVNFISD